MNKFIGLLAALLLLQVALSDQYGAWLVAAFSQYNYRHAALLLGVLLTALLVEFLTVGWQRSTARKFFQPTPSFVRDIAYYAMDLSLFLYSFGVILSFGGIAEFSAWSRPLVREHLLLDAGFGFLDPWLAATLSTLLGILIVDFCWYWGHWLEHKIPALWELHAYHHSATEMSILTTLRKHPISEPLIRALIGIPIVALNVFTAHEYILLVFAEKVLGHLAHSEIRSDWGIVGKVLVSPHFHRVHHSMIDCHQDKNFGMLFSLWDRLFGTCYRGDVPPAQLGVKDDYYNRHNLLAEMVYGYFKCCRTLAAPLRRWFA